MKINTLHYIALLGILLSSFNSFGQTWYWTKQADSSSTQTATQVAVDRNDNPYYTGYFEGARMSFGPFGIDNVCTQSDFLVKYNTNGTPLWARNGLGLTTGALIYGSAVATDHSNNVLESGYFYDSIAFGAYHLNSMTTYNTYLVKYDGSGNVLWATAPALTKTKTIYYNQNYGVTADKQNNIYITGYFEDTVIFGHDTLITSDVDMYLVKYNSSGHVIWATAPILQNSSCYTYGLSVATDDSGNAYVSGNIYDTVTFQTIKVGSTGTGSVYLAKYDSSGHIKWAFNTTATPGSVLPTPVVTDRSNNVYLGAQFTNASIAFGTYTVTDGDPGLCSNSLLAKYTPNGKVIWATCADFISDDEVCVIIESAVTTDRCNNVYWSGLCSDSFGVGNVKVTVSGGASHPSTAFAYVIKLDSNANPIAGAALRNENSNSFSNYLACDSLSKVLFASELVAPATMTVGNDTVVRYLTNSTCFLSKFAVVPTIVNSKNNDTICQGDSIVLGITSVPGTSYAWSTGATTTDVTVKPSTTTTYYVIANNGCIKDTSFIKVTVMPNTPAIIHGKDSVCKGDTVILVGSGGITYTWSTSQTTDSIKVSPSTTTTYTLTANNGGCSRDTTFTIYIIATPTAVVGANPDSVCQGDSTKLTGSGGVSYKWSTGSTLSSIWVVPTATTTYTLTAFAGTCSSYTTVTVGVAPITTATVSPTDTICPGDSAQITVTGSGGKFSYMWNTGSTSSSIYVKPGTTTTYTASVMGQCDTAVKTVTVMVEKLPTAVFTGQNWECKGNNETVSVSGGCTYVWNSGSTSTSYKTGNINGDSTLIVTVKNCFGCTVTDTFKIEERLTPTVTFTNVSTCAGVCVKLDPKITSNPAPTYLWNTGATTDTTTVCPDSTSTYTLTVSNGCPITKTTTITVFAPSLYACCSDTIQIGDTATLTAKSSSKYNWYPSAGLNCDTCPTVKATPSVTTSYTVVGTASDGCAEQMVLTVVVEIPCFNFTVPNVFTPDNPGALGANGGTNNIFYIETKNITGWSCVIFDRWGKEMFKTTNPTDYWDGTTESGGKAPDGVYYYIISGTCQNNTYKKDGFLQLIR